MKNHLNNIKGFTLIEIILVVAIISVVSSFGFVALNEIGKSQGADSAVSDFINLIYEAKSNTLSQVKVGGNCPTTNLVGYKILVDSAADPATYSLSIVCGTSANLPATWTTTNIKSGTFPSDTGVDVYPADNFMFSVPNALVSDETTINLVYGDKTSTITVATSGAIFK